MGAIQKACLSWSDTERELRDFRADLEAISDDVRASVAQAMAGDSELNKSVDAALAAVGSVFGSTVSGTLNAVLADSGMDVPDQSKSQVTGLGFYKAAGRYWIVNTKVAAPTTSTASYGVAGIGDGIASLTEISTLLGREVVDPDQEAMDTMMKTAFAGSASTANASKQDDSGSGTGSRSVPGNIANLRELYRGCGSDLGVLDQFLDDSYSLGFGCVWSVSLVVIVQRPQLPTVFDADYVRKQLNSVCFDDDMDFEHDSKYCFVRTEAFLGYNITKQEAEARARALEAAQRLQPNSLGLITRTVRFRTQEDVLESAPIIVSRGCDCSKLNGSAYTIGLSVNGIYRVIDCTGDSGQKIVRTQYSVQDIVDSVTEVFGDLVDCGVVGSDFFIRLRRGFGALGSLSLFWSGSADCSNEIGLEAAVVETAQGKAKILSQVISAQSSVSLRDLGEVFWYGGSFTPATIPSSFQITYMRSNMTQEQSDAVSGSMYWDLIQNKAATATHVLNAALSGTGDKAKAVADLESLLMFYDAANTGYREYKTLRVGFGAATHKLLIQDLDVSYLDVYSSTATVRGRITSLLNSISSNDGVLGSTGSWMTSTQPQALNYAVAARTRLLYSETTDYDYLEAATAASAAAELLSYSESIVPATNSVAQKTSSESTFSKILDGTEELLSAVSDLTGVDAEKVLWNIIKDIPGMSEALNSSSYVQSAASAVEDGIGDLVRTVDDYVKDLLGSVGLTALDRKAINVILKLQAGIEQASVIAGTLRTIYNQTTRKIVALSNFNLNLAGSLGFQTKYLSCYVSGAVDYKSALSLANMVQILNDSADAFNQRLLAAQEAVDKALDKLVCMLDSLVLSLTGTMTYETTMQSGIVTLKFNCTSYVNLGSSFSPKVLSHVFDLRRQLDYLIASLRLHHVTFKKHRENVNATATVFAGTLEDTANLLLSKLGRCF